MKNVHVSTKIIPKIHPFSAKRPYPQEAQALGLRLFPPFHLIGVLSFFIGLNFDDLI